MIDVAPERAVLAGICEYGADIYLDVCDYVKVDTFTVDSNKCIFRCLEKICKEDDNAKVDLPSILSAAHGLGLSHIIERTEEAKHLSSVMKLHVDKENVRKFAAKIRKLEVARLIHKQAGVLQEKMGLVDGGESVAQIISSAEDIIFDFTSLMEDDDSKPALLGDDIESYIEYLASNPTESIGVKTGYSAFDKAIGGGIRDGTLNVIGGRSKSGKSIITDNVSYYMACQNIPVLNMDTEMLREDHMHRSLAMLSGVSINNIESGKFGQSPDLIKKVKEAGEKLSKIPYYHRSIAGMPFEDQLSLMRRWIQKEVGFKQDGTAKPCVIIYDYLKLMDTQGISAALQEYQLLGFMMTSLHNFAVRYKIPFIVLIQLNRDGINREGADVASGSDRIIWLCSNFSIFKEKSAEEIEADGPDGGNRKLVVVCSRHGPGTDFGDYICMNMQGWKAKISEIGLKSELGAVRNGPDEFIVNDDVEDGADIPFE